MPLATPKGLITLPLSGAATHEIIAWYEGPPHWQERNAVVAVLLVLLLIALKQMLRVSHKTEQKRVKA